MKFCKKMASCLVMLVFPVILSGCCNNLSGTQMLSDVEVSNVKSMTASSDIVGHDLKAGTAPSLSLPIIVVNPTFELADLIERYENGLNTVEQEAGLIEMRTKWLNLKKNGYTRWGSEKWMKDPNYYESLNTFKLAEECFSRTVFANEMGIYNNPIAGFESLKIFHNGFAELFKRKDMWKGILHVYDYLSLKLNTESDLITIVSISMHFDELRKLYGLSPLKEQVKSREKLFLAANLRVLKKYKLFLENYDPKKLGTEGSPGFFREPCSVAQVALMLAKEVDPQRYAEIEPAITSVRWTEEQKVQDLASFINLVIKSLDGFVTKQDEKQLDEILWE